MGFWLSLGVQMTHVTRRTTPKSTITEHTKNLIVAPKILSDPKKFQNQYFFQTQIFLDTKFFRTKIFRTQKKISSNFFSDLNFFIAPKLFSCQNFFRTQDFVRPKKMFRPKIISNPKWTSMKTIFWGRKQSFCTWGFRNWQGQRFYLNWSLTLKTKSCFVLILFEQYFLLFPQPPVLAAYWRPGCEIGP